MFFQKLLGHTARGIKRLLGSGAKINLKEQSSGFFKVFAWSVQF
jgi:hypothetical protein